MEKMLKLDEVVIDNGLNPREGALDQEAITEYAANVEALPMMRAFEIDGRYHLTRGFHRFAAHQLAGLSEAMFEVFEGGWDLAQEDADLDNLQHGLRLTRVEKRAVIARQLKRHPERSDVRLGRECHTTDKTVRSVREELENNSEIPRLEKLVGSDGVERPRTIGKPEPEPTPDATADAEPEWLEDDGFSNGGQEPPPAPEKVEKPAPKPEPPPPPPPKLPPLPPPIIKETLDAHISVWVQDKGGEKKIIIMGTKGLTSLEARPVGLDEIGAEVQRLVDESMAMEAIA